MARADYVLQPGDTVRVNVIGLAELDAVAAIDNDGVLRFPLFEPIEAADLTLTALQDSMRGAVVGRLLRRYDASSAPSFVTLNPDDLYLSVGEYRPVHVYGAVGRPGSLPYRPGVTVRAAIAAAGGLSSVSAAFRGLSAPETGARLQGDFQSLSQERARLRAQLWRIDSALGESADPPDAATLGVSEAAAQSLIAAQTEMLALADKQRVDQLSYLTETIAQTEQRITILTEQVRLLTEGLKTDEEETQRISGLREKGIVAVNRLSDVKRAEVLSANRLLDTQNDLESVRMNRTRLLSELESFESRRREGLLADRQTMRGRLEELTVRLASLREQMAINGVTAVALDASLQSTTVITVHRRQGAVTLSHTPDLDELLQPGDVIEAQLIEPAL